MQRVLRTRQRAATHAGRYATAATNWPRYEKSALRIALVTLNPAAGRKHTRDNERFRLLLHRFRDGGPFEPVAEHTYCGLRKKAWFGGNFEKLYIDEFGLKLDEIALANIAWCAADGNKYDDLLRPCLKLNTARLLSELKPDVVLLAGGGAILKDVQDACPWAEVGVVMHCSYLNRPQMRDEETRKGYIAQKKAEFDEIMERGRTRRASRDSVER